MQHLPGPLHLSHVCGGHLYHVAQVCLREYLEPRVHDHARQPAQPEEHREVLLRSPVGAPHLDGCGLATSPGPDPALVQLCHEADWSQYKIRVWGQGR